MGQLTEYLKANLWGLSTLQSIKDDNDVIVFIRSIKYFAFKYETHKNIHVFVWNMKKRTVNMYQNYLDSVK